MEKKYFTILVVLIGLLAVSKSDQRDDRVKCIHEDGIILVHIGMAGKYNCKRKHAKQQKGREFLHEMKTSIR